MLKNHLQIAFRNLLKQKAYSFFNAVGLSTGIAAGLIIALYLQQELSYEKEFTDYDNIYRVHNEGWAKSSPPLAIEMQSFLPRLHAVGRFAFYGTRVVNTNESSPGEVTGFYADSSIIDVFNFKILEGNAKHGLSRVGTAVITETMAKRYFGNAVAVGKVLKFDNREEFVVAAVMQALPKKSHLKFDYLISMPTFYQGVPDSWTSKREWMALYTYVKFRSDEDFRHSLSLWSRFLRKFYQGAPDIEERVAQQRLKFMPLKDIHLKSNLEQEMGPNGSMLYVYIFIVIEALILIVACANFMSLFTTQAIKRMKEVGMRKIMGAKPAQLMMQVFTEVVVLTIFSVVLAVVMYQLVLPFYNSISGNDLGVWQIFERNNLQVVAVIFLVIVVLSGLYPAFFIARFKAGSFLKEDKLPNSIPNRVRNGLVIFQFAVSAALIASAVLVQQQLDLIQNKNLGFDKEQLVDLKLYGRLWWRMFSETDVVRNELLKNADILAVGRTGSAIGDDMSVEGVVPEGREQEEDKFPSVRVQRIDDQYLTAMGVSFVAGKNFSGTANDSSSFILNESAVRALGLTDPLGQRLNNVTIGKIGTITGIVKDYHFASLHQAVEPLVLEYKPEWTNYLTLRFRAGKTKETLEYIRLTIDKIAPGSLFAYTFLDDRLNQLYQSENAMGRIFQFFSVLAIIIACLGLFSLSAFTVESRTKEIGVRKVLGATVSRIIAMISSRFFVLVLTGYGIAVPLTWFGISRWLQNFAYQISIEWWVFALTGIIIFIVAAVVISVHTVSGALRNPVRSLRYE